MVGEVDFQEMIGNLKEDIVTLAEVSLKRFANEAKADALQLVDSMRDKLVRWTALLASGDLTTEDFEWLVNSQKSLAEMHALKEAGLAAIRIDQFKNSVLNLIVDTVFSFIKI